MNSDVSQDEQQIARKIQAIKSRLRGGRRGGRGGRVVSQSGRDSPFESEYVDKILFLRFAHSVASSDTQTKRKPQKSKEQRKWGHEAPTESEMSNLDFSNDKPEDADATLSSKDLEALVDKNSYGERTGDIYEVKDWDFLRDKPGSDDNDIISNALRPLESKGSTSSMGILGSIVGRLTGTKVLTDDDLKPVLEAMKQHLMKKNVAMDIANKVCEGVGESLVGQKVGGFQSTLILQHHFQR